MSERTKVIMAGSIPQCPKCNKPTRRTTSGMSRRTLAYYKPIYDENGNNTNPDLNTSTTGYKCLDCGELYTVSGNSFNGYFYK